MQWDFAIDYTDYITEYIEYWYILNGQLILILSSEHQHFWDLFQVQLL